MRQIVFILFVLPCIVYSQDDERPFQVLVAEKASTYGMELKPLDFVNDHMAIDIEDGGFVTLVHEDGSTFELSESVYTSKLEVKTIYKSERPVLGPLFKKKAVANKETGLSLLHPNIEGGETIVMNMEEQLEIRWDVAGKHILSNKVSVFDADGNKIQDFGSGATRYNISPKDIGFTSGSFKFQISSTLLEEVITTGMYNVELTTDTYKVKASDLVLKAYNLESKPMLALNIWYQIFAMQNGKHYDALFEKFIQRNKSVLGDASLKAEQLLSRNKSG